MLLTWLQSNAISLQFLTVAAGSYPQNCGLIYQFANSTPSTAFRKYSIAPFVGLFNSFGCYPQNCRLIYQFDSSHTFVSEMFKYTFCLDQQLNSTKMKELLSWFQLGPPKRVVNDSDLPAILECWGMHVHSKLRTHLPIWLRALFFRKCLNTLFFQNQQLLF